MSKVIAVDFDDIVFDCNSAMAEFHNALYGTDYKVEDISTWSLAETWGVSKEEEGRRITEFVMSDYHAGAVLIDGAHDGLTKLKQLGFKIIFVTSRGESFQPYTEAWMQKNITGLYDAIVYTNHFEKDHINHRSKAEVCMEIGATALIEDAIHHTENVSQAGIPVLLLDKPWNKNFVTGPNIHRVHSWAEILDWVKAH